MDFKQRFFEPADQPDKINVIADLPDNLIF